MNRGKATRTVHGKGKGKRIDTKRGKGERTRQGKHGEDGEAAGTA
jgi:hypothetical protein